MRHCKWFAEINLHVHVQEMHVDICATASAYYALNAAALLVRKWLGKYIIHAHIVQVLPYKWLDKIYSHCTV